MKGKGERERYTQLNAEFQRIARRNKKAFLKEQYKNREKRQNRKDQRSLQENWGEKGKKKKIGNIFPMQGNITSKDGHDKGQKQ